MGTLMDRVLRCVELTDDCWLWTARKDRWGYGLASRSALAERMAHRFVYRLLVGDIPDGHELDHLCKVRHCVNPDHLEAVTPLVNWERSNSPSRINSLKTHCKRGHEFTPENTRVGVGSSRGKRRGVIRTCRACDRIRQAESQARKNLRGVA